MHSLGLVPSEPNPFVFTGEPKVGQVWLEKATQHYWFVATLNGYEDYIHLIPCHSLQTVKDLRVPPIDFHKRFVFSH